MLRSTDIPLLYVDCDIPGGQTLAEWRQAKNVAERRTITEAREARAASRAAAFKRLLPRLGVRPAPAPALRPRFA
jgi:hypothetical protein